MIVDGGWGGWDEWDACSKTCGNGTKIRTRRCDKPFPDNNGKACFGPASQLMTCNYEECYGNEYS